MVFPRHKKKTKHKEKKKGQTPSPTRQTRRDEEKQKTFVKIETPTFFKTFLEKKIHSICD